MALRYAIFAPVKVVRNAKLLLRKNKAYHTSSCVNMHSLEQKHEVQIRVEGILEKTI